MKNRTNIQLLLKFVSKREYAEDLCRGTLFMHSSQYYHHLENIGQGDMAEASLFSGVCMYRGADFPIYCMFSVSSADINSNCIEIPERIIEDFSCSNGFVVVINYRGFINKLSLIDTNGYSLIGDQVQYGTPTFELSTQWLCSNSCEHLFVKRPWFSYQREFRIVVTEPLPPRIVPKYHDGILMNFAYYDTYRTYHIPNGIQDISDICTINTLSRKGSSRYINLTDCPHSWH